MDLQAAGIELRTKLGFRRLSVRGKALTHSASVAQSIVIRFAHWRHSGRGWRFLPKTPEPEAQPHCDAALAQSVGPHKQSITVVTRFIDQQTCAITLEITRGQA